MGKEGKKQWRGEGREKKEGTRKGGREGKKKTIREGAQAGRRADRQAGVLSGFVSLSGSGADYDSDTAAADSGDCNIAILGVDLPYLSQEIPDDFWGGQGTCMYTLRCTTTHEWRRIQ